ncbi:MAG: DUF2920 family protein [Campylobacter sp.]|nr:DUF2920 family protein [Campylobacter sp.]
MLVNKTYEIVSTDDIELGIKRESLLEFRLSFDDECEMNAIVFIVPGLGGDANDNYKEHLAEFTAREFNVAVASVNYHCIGNRPQTGAKYFFDKADQFILKKKCDEIGISLDGDLSFLEQSQLAIDTLLKISNLINSKKDRGELAKDFLLHISLTLQPTKNEYQNFGIMQAMDLLNALKFIKKSAPFKMGGGSHEIDKLPVIVVGSSHGGYLAHMAAKIAPWLIDGVIDNSSYAKYPFRFVGFGKEIDYTKYCGYQTTKVLDNASIYVSDKTLWTLDSNSERYFSEAREEIRYVLNLDHLKTQSKYPKPIYVSYHSAKDEYTAPANDKAELYEVLKELKFDASLTMIKDESQIDGKFIKNLTHGMDMSIKSLIIKELPIMLKKLAKRKKPKRCSKNISYVSVDRTYKFYEDESRVGLEIL